MTERPEYLSITQAARALGVSRQTVYAWLASRRLASERIAGRHVVRASVVADVLASRAAEQAA